MTVSEEDLIARFFAPIAGPGGLRLRDDAALVSVPDGHELVVTQDAIVAGVHFFEEDPPSSVARKALGVNLSDLAAKSARPLAFLLSLALPQGWTVDWLSSFATALGEAARGHDCPLIGGDTVATPGPIMLSITALGLVARGMMLRRDGAKVGDIIYVSGTVGDGALGLVVRRAELEGAGPIWIADLDEGSRSFLRDRFWHPQPRLALQPALALASGGMDVSDGLVGDLSKMLRVSGVTGRIETSLVPLSEAATQALRVDFALREPILTGGDDYEVLATVAPAKAAAFESEAARCGVAVTPIGSVQAGTGPLEVVDGSGAAVSFRRGSFSHT